MSRTPSTPGPFHWPFTKGQPAPASTARPRFQNRKSQIKNQKSSFTLIELMVVLGILVIVAGLIVGMATHANRAASESRAVADIEKLRDAIQEYRFSHGSLPDSLSTDWLPTGLATNDPWHQPFRYQWDSESSYTLYSAGYDGVFGLTNGICDDIVAGR